MSQNVRIVLAFALSALILFVWNTFIIKPQPRVPHNAVAGETLDGGAPAQDQTAQNTPPAAAPAATPIPAGNGEPADNTPPEKVRVETDRWIATFSTKGAGVTSFELLGHKQEQRGKKETVDLAHPGPAQPPPLAAEVQLPNNTFAPTAMYRVEKQGPDEIVFSRQQNGTTITKRFTWAKDSYVIKLNLAVTNAPAGGTAPVRLYYTAHELQEGSSSMFSIGPRLEPHQTVCHLAGENGLKSHAHTETKVGMETLLGTPTFAGIDEKYFLAAMSPGSDPAPSECQIGATEKGDHLAILQRTITLTGTTASTGFDLFLGPKDVDQLRAAGHELEKAIDFGFFAIICHVLLGILRFFEGIFRNWGVAIIALTLLVKAATFPLTHKQMKSMEDMRRLTPLMEAIKTKYAGDQQRINVETMKLYKEHNTQPLAGCLPMLIQMPVWLALYTTLSTSFQLYNEPFVGWIHDLTSQDPYYVTPIAMTVTMLVSQLLTPQTAQAQQMKAMTYGMPIFFGAIMMNLPSGLVLYIFTNNLLSIAQSLWFRRKFGSGAPPTAAPA